MSHNTPCRGCTPETGRSITCHTVCEKYKAWAEDRNILLKKRLQIKKLENDIREIRGKSIKKSTRKGTKK